MNSNKNNIIKKIEKLKEEDKDKNNNIIKIHKTNYNSNIKCFWCKNYFNNKSINMPVSYLNDTFTVQGHYCSFNCMLSHSIDIGGDKHWYRTSLINFFYYKTYGKFINITPAPHWKCLKEYGGCLSIEDFRSNFLTKKFILLDPPIKVRTSSILELDRKTNDKYVLKRTKPINRKTSNITNFLN